MKRFLRSVLLRLFDLTSSLLSSNTKPKGIINYKNLPSNCKKLFYSLSETTILKGPFHKEEKLHLNFTRLKVIKPIQTFVIEAENFRVWGNQGAVITSDGYLFSEVSREFGERDHSIFNQFQLHPIENLEGIYAVVAASGSNVYYHWMFDILPRFDILKQTKSLVSIDKFILNYTGLRYQIETLKKIGVSHDKVLCSTNHWNFHVKLERLIIPSLPSPNNIPSKQSCIYLRRLYYDEIANNEHSDRIYIQRLSTRRIINEKELLEVLAPLGFKIINSENLTVSEQARVFSKAAIVIGAHGAGLSNIVFCKPKTYIMDIFSPTWVNPCYWIISNHIQLNYSYMIGEYTFRAEKTSKANDIIVSLSKFKLLLNSILDEF